MLQKGQNSLPYSLLIFCEITQYSNNISKQQHQLAKLRRSVKSYHVLLQKGQNSLP